MWLNIENKVHKENGAFQNTPGNIKRYWAKLDTGRSYDKNSPEDNMLVAKAALTDQLIRFNGNVHMAIWAYNGGEKHVLMTEKALAKKGEPTSPEAIRRQFIKNRTKGMEELIVTFEYSEMVLGDPYSRT